MLSNCTPNICDYINIHGKLTILIREASFCTRYQSSERLVSSQSDKKMLLRISDSSLNGTSMSFLHQTYAHPPLRLRKQSRRRGRKNVNKQRTWKDTVQFCLQHTHSYSVYDLMATVVTCKRASKPNPSRDREDNYQDKPLAEKTLAMNSCSQKTLSWEGDGHW